jgi:uncharacterized protein (DUF488 family)
MEIYSIGFTKKSASQFFGALKAHGIERLLDVRLNNTSQLAGFAKQSDLPYFLHEICGVSYEHEPQLAPTRDILDAFKKHNGNWDVYTQAYLSLLRSRRVEATISKAGFLRKTVLLCSEASSEHCHRKLALEYLQQHWGDVIIHHL